MSGKMFRRTFDHPVIASAKNERKRCYTLAEQESVNDKSDKYP